MVVVEDLTGEDVTGAFYTEEVQLINWDGAKTVEKVLGTRVRADVTERRVTYVGWPENYAEWIVQE